MRIATETVISRIEDALTPNAKALMGMLEAKDYEAFVVGGFIRDAILGREAYDIDIATNAKWQDVRDICQENGLRTYETGVKHGTITVIFPEEPDTNASETTVLAPEQKSHNCAYTSAYSTPHASSESDIHCVNKIEVTTYRTEGSYSDSRHPDKVEFVASIEEDLARRDFTMNAIAYNPHIKIVDPFGGIKDIETGTIRLVGDGERFKEDGLRILRAARFVSQLGFNIEENTYSAMLRSKSVLRKVSVERITHELDGLLLGEYADRALLETVDVISFVLPELVAMKGCQQHTKYHIYDVLEHTAHVVKNSPRTRLSRWAALCHDMGKPAAAFFDAEGVEHFYGHAVVSVQIARGMLKRLLMSGKFIDDVCLLVRLHDDVVAPDRRTVKRMLNKLDGRVDMFKALCALKRADASAQAPMCAPRIQLADELVTILEEVLACEEAFSIRDLTIDGNDLLTLGIPRGPEIGATLNALLEKVIAGDLQNERGTLLDAAQAHV